jgi:hypothetical protein
MTKSGAMYQVTAAFLELFQGLAGVPLAFGFPNRRAMALGERLGLYSEVGALSEIRWPALADRPQLRTRVAHLDLNDTDRQQMVDRLWAAMRRDLCAALVGVRDAKYLMYRYVGHPEHRYELVQVTSRLSGAPLGVLVLRIQKDSVELLDLVAPLGCIPLLVLQARRLAGRWGKATVYGWITRQYARRLAGANGCVTDPDIRIPTNAWVHQALSAADLYDRWWLTSGDTDFR